MAIKPQTHRILEHVDADPGDVPAVGDVLTRTAGGEWDAQPGGAGGGPHAAAQHNAATLPGGFAESFGAAYYDQAELAAPATPPADSTRSYTSDLAGRAERFYKDDAGIERPFVAPLIRPRVYFPVVATLINQPAAETEVSDVAARQWVDLTKVRRARFRLRVQVAGAVGPPPAKVRPKYATTNAGPFEQLASVDGDLDIDISTEGTKETALVNIAAAGQANVIVSMFALNGNGVADPNFGSGGLEVE